MVDHLVSKHLTIATVIERALHDHRPLWTMKLGDLVVPATPRVTEEGVVFEAKFPEHCWLSRPVQLTLQWDDMPMLSHSCDPSDTGSTIEWEITLGVNVLV